MAARDTSKAACMVRILKGFFSTQSRPPLAKVFPHRAPAILQQFREISRIFSGRIRAPFGRVVLVFVAGLILRRRPFCRRAAHHKTQIKVRKRSQMSRQVAFHFLFDWQVAIVKQQLT